VNQAVCRQRSKVKRSDIITENKKEKTCALIDVAIPADRFVKRRTRNIRPV
jgi:hypothetical protein